MSKKILVISTSLRANSNSDMLAEAFMDGARQAGHIDEISPRPILFVVGDRAHSRFFSDVAYERALEPKEMLVVEDAEHIDLYDRRDRIPFDRLADFFTVNMK